MTKKPLIAITPQVVNNEFNKILPGYLHSILEAGGIPVLLSKTDDIDNITQIINDFDAFLIPGGQDVDPSLYGEKKTPYLRETSPDRDAFEQILIKELVKTDKPVLGICRGLQIMNIVLGGSLYQDITSQNVTQTHHFMSLPYDRVFHKVNILPKTPLFNIIEETTIGVNSRHHQAIKKIAPCFSPMAFSEDGIMEALYAPKKSFCIGVQWHPEDMYDKFEHSQKLFKAFIEAAKKDL